MNGNCVLDMNLRLRNIATFKIGSVPPRKIRKAWAFGPVKVGLVWSGIAWPGQLRPVSARLDSVPFARLDSVPFGTTQLSRARSSRLLLARLVSDWFGRSALLGSSRSLVLLACSGHAFDFEFCSLARHPKIEKRASFEIVRYLPREKPRTKRPHTLGIQFNSIPLGPSWVSA